MVVGPLSPGRSCNRETTKLQRSSVSSHGGSDFLSGGRWCAARFARLPRALSRFLTFSSVPCRRNILATRSARCKKIIFVRGASELKRVADHVHGAIFYTRTHATRLARPPHTTRAPIAPLTAYCSTRICGQATLITLSTDFLDLLS